MESGQFMIDKFRLVQIRQVPYSENQVVLIAESSSARDRAT